LPPILAEYRRLFPKVAILVREAPTRELESGLGAGELDLALVSTDDGADGDFFCEDQLVLVARSRSVDPHAPFVTFPRGAHARDVLDELFPDAVIAMEIASIAAVKANVRAGVGIALVSRRAVARDLANHQLVELPSPRTPVVRTLSLVHRGVTLLPPAALALRELMLARRPGNEAIRHDSRPKRADRPKSKQRKTTLGE
jgi:DNA-binding transcriptional LysR family regulator